MYTVGRAIQFAGLVILPLAMLFELQERVTLGQMLVMTVFGATLFYLGYILSGYGAK